MSSSGGAFQCAAGDGERRDFASGGLVTGICNVLGVRLGGFQRRGMGGLLIAQKGRGVGRVPSAGEVLPPERRDLQRFGGGVGGLFIVRQGKGGRGVPNAGGCETTLQAIVEVPLPARRQWRYRFQQDDSGGISRTGKGEGK